MNLDKAVRRHNLRACVQWVVLLALLAVMFLYGPKLAYQLFYERYVRDTVVEVLEERDAH
jgi:hypothetical protein